MKVLMRDRASLSSISIVSLRAYLNSRGWTDEGTWGERPVTVFAKDHDRRTWEILVPHRDTIGGYAENMAETVEILSTVEDRSQLNVYYDLLGAGADSIRLRSTNGMSDEALSLRQSAHLLNDAYDMMAATARAAEKPQATYRGSMSSKVREYLDSIHPLPVPHLGYDLTLHSNVPAGIGTPVDMGDEFLPPFPRLVTLKLSEALEHSNAALSDAVAKESLEPFTQAVVHGVSSNLCESVAELVRKGGGIEINLSWADVRPSNVTESGFKFSRHSADILSEVASNFRRNEPFLDESIIAHVVKLEREPEEFDGRATILYVREGCPLRMQVEFEQPAYGTVIGAFEQRVPISVDGDIYQSGSGYELRRPHNLSLVPE